MSMGAHEDLAYHEPPSVQLPAMKVKVGGYYGYLCLWGFASGELVHLSMYEPGGRLVAAKDVVAESTHKYSPDVMVIDLWFPGLQTGEWRATATCSQVSLEYRFTVSEASDSTTGVMPGSAVDIFDGARGHNCHMNAYSPDDGFVVFGAGLPPRQEFPCGIYRSDSSEHVKLVYRRMVTTDERGRFLFVVPGDLSWPAGEYWVVVPQQVQHSELNMFLSGCFVIRIE